MTVDIRCQVYCRFGTVVEGRISDRKVDGAWLITTRGAIVIDRIFNPKKGKIVDLSYRRGDRVAPFPRLLTVLRATPDPHRGVTVLDVGDPLELLADRKERTTADAPSAPYVKTVQVGGSINLAVGEEAVAVSRKAPPPVSADSILQTCLVRLGLTLTGDSDPLTGQYLQDKYDLSEGYVNVLQKLVESHACYAYVTRAGKLRIKKLRLDQPEPGPLFTWQDLAEINRIQGAPVPPDVVEVSYDGREAPGAAGATDSEWYPVVDDGLGSVDNWTNTLGELGDGYDDLWNGDFGSGESFPDPDEDSFRNWELDTASGSAESITIRYGEDQQATFSLVPFSESRTAYQQYSFFDQRSGRNVTKEYVSTRATTQNTTLAAANGAYVKWALEEGAGVPSSALWNTSVSRYEYSEFTQDGPLVITETITEYISGAQMAGSLGISDYTGITLPSGTYVASITVTKTINSPNGGSSKVIVQRRLAWGLTQEGNQAAASAIETGSPAAVQQVIDDMGVLMNDGIEVRTAAEGSGGRRAMDELSLGQRRQRDGWQLPQSRPSPQELLADAIDPRGGDEKTIRKVFSIGGDDLTGRWESPMNDSEDAVTLRVKVPLSPDDWVAGVPPSGGAVKIGTALQRGSATLSAQEYGEAVMQLAVGGAWGLAVMGDPWRLPSAPLARLYLTHGGATNCYAMDGMSWNFNDRGMAVGADTLLCGAVGEAEA